VSGPRDLVIVGAGGFGREAAEAARAIAEFHLLGFLDDDPSMKGTMVGGLPVLGGPSEIGAFSGARVVVCPGRPGSRKELVQRLELGPQRYATIIHPSAVIPSSATIGHGTVILANVVATTSVRIGAHVAVMPGVVLTHDDEVADFATFGAGACLSGRVRVGEGAYIGAGALIRENLVIGEGSLVGMGAVVTRDVPSGETWVGTPARLLHHGGKS
jgi:sugar O-acyltransferase (sialic acid O-acetyltransferase NeuD family)